MRWTIKGKAQYRISFNGEESYVSATTPSNAFMEVLKRRNCLPSGRIQVSMKEQSDVSIADLEVAESRHIFPVVAGIPLLPLDLLERVMVSPSLLIRCVKSGALPLSIAVALFCQYIERGSRIPILRVFTGTHDIYCAFVRVCKVLAIGFHQGVSTKRIIQAAWLEWSNR